ncbi:hypothetical protein [Paenibacillus ehimensis]|uniref:Uncharacterized protein n=1 Tax=Paenibacillus ehimensis TaxID=79264 RepID=A0ABT8VM49_9BACL|nr:hypothetical protein [Paenibacillus ehimensis]MDO3682063.1 hypothetical protein [Paenibacillus ehimensis]MEC0213188.1 hypothetical protein [Paenibacillus ehimensis]
MKIETTDYQIAPLLDQEKVVDIIQQAEARLAELTGRPITLIAYSKTEGENNL